jgi:hypothetical protein
MATAKLLRVGCLGISVGGKAKISVPGLSAMLSIQAKGNRKRTSTARTAA